jgi:DNA-binding response OmpR family regulator
MPSSINVLIVEDNRDHADSLRMVLERRMEVKYAVEMVPTVKAATARLRRGGIDAVLLDLSLPDASGTEAVHLVKEAGPDVGVLVLTGWGDAEEPAKAAGADEFLTKPAEPATLSVKLQFVAIESRHHKKMADLYEILKGLAGAPGVVTREVADQLESVRDQLDSARDTVIEIEKRIKP